MSATTATQTAPASSGPTTAPRPHQGPGGNILVAVLAVLSLIWVIPLVFILINSFKSKFCNPPLAIGYFFQTRNFESLAFF